MSPPSKRLGNLVFPAVRDGAGSKIHRPPAPNVATFMRGGRFAGLEGNDLLFT